MPTAMKNSPSSSPLNGSMSSSSWWRYSDSASITPARKAPSAIDSPTRSIMAATPITSSREKPTKTSRWPVPAMTRKSGRSAKRPAATSSTIMASARAAASHSRLPRDCSGASRASSSMSGITARSWNRSTEKLACPPGVPSSRFSCSVASAMAVEDMAKPMPATSATISGTPSATPQAVTAASVATTCTAPIPRIERRICHRRCGLSPSPTKKSRSTTPNSANCRIASGSDTSFSPDGPIAMPAARKPSTDPRPRRLNTGTATTPAAR